MLKQAIMAIAAMGALSVSSPADAHGRDRGHARVVISYGTPVYYGHRSDGYYRDYYDPYYYPRYRYRHRYHNYDGYYRPRHRHWKKRHWRHHRPDRYYRD